MDTRELERIKAAKRFDKFDFALNNALHGILKIAADTYDTPAAFITLIEADDQWFKVNHGFEVLRMPRDTSFCTHTILKHEPLVICDALEDERFTDNPLVKNSPNIRFYAGAALTDYQGQNIGTLCVMDAHPKNITHQKKELLQIMAKQAIHLMEMEFNYQAMTEKLQASEKQNAAFKDIAFLQSYEFRTPLDKIADVVKALKQKDGNGEEQLQTIESLLNELDGKINSIEQATEVARTKFIDM